MKPIQTSGVRIASVRIRLVMLGILNTLDLVLTFALLSSGLFTECNPLVSAVLPEGAATLLCKAVLPSLLLLILCVRVGRAREEQLRTSLWIVNAALVFYTLVNLHHILWIGQTLPLL